MVVVQWVEWWMRIEVWRKVVTVEARIEIEVCGVVGYESWLEWRAVDSAGGFVA